MLPNLDENPRKSGLCVGGRSLLKMPGEKSVWGGIENFRFCLGGELTLDDTMFIATINFECVGNFATQLLLVQERFKETIRILRQFLGKATKLTIFNGFLSCKISIKIKVGKLFTNFTRDFV